MKILIVIMLLLLLVGCSQLPDTVKVIRVIDGDTIIIEGGYRVRYIDIDAPELDEPNGLEAWRANYNLVEDKVVQLKRNARDKDVYGRLLRYVYVDGTSVSAELVGLGLANWRER